MYETSDFKKGLKIMIEGKPYVIVDLQHVKPYFDDLNIDFVLFGHQAMHQDRHSVNDILSTNKSLLL